MSQQKQQFEQQDDRQCYAGKYLLNEAVFHGVHLLELSLSAPLMYTLLYNK